MEKGTKFKHLTWNDRLVIERMILKGYSKKAIADAVGCTLKTVYNEIKRSTYIHTNSDYTTEVRYNPDGSQQKYKANLKKKGAEPKLKKDAKLVEYIENMIIDLKYSPEAVLLHIKDTNQTFTTEVKAVGTIYSGIKKGYFNKLKMQYLPRRGVFYKRKKKVTIQKRVQAGTSIEKRPEEINTRKTFGHWEMDCVVGKSTNRKTLLVFTERKTRYEIIEVLKTHTCEEVVKAINRLEKRFKSNFYKIFKSITVDNGSEFKDNEGMEKALYRVGKRTNLYYCHPHAPHERGSNENANLLIRRFYKKGLDFDKNLKKSEVKDVEFWINTYPRKILDGKNAQEVFDNELSML